MLSILCILLGEKGKELQLGVILAKAVGASHDIIII